MHALAGSLLHAIYHRCHVGRCVCTRVARQGVSRRLGQAHVRQLRRTILAQQHIGWLHAAAISKSDKKFVRERIAENVAKSLILLNASDEPRPFHYPMTSDDLSDNVRCSSSDDARITGSKAWNRVDGLRKGFLSLEVVADDFQGPDRVTENHSR